jgi:hypothetical protein
MEGGQFALGYNSDSRNMGAEIMRKFGHKDPVGENHHGPESRWHKQWRRQLKRAEASKDKPKASRLRALLKKAV